MNDVIDNAQALKKELNKNKLVQEYMQIKHIFEKNDELKQLQKEIVRAKNENRLDDYKTLKKKYETNPLVENYLSLKEEVASLLKEICDIVDL